MKKTRKEQVYGIDIGLSGGISNGSSEIAMPIYSVMIKEPVMVQAKDSKGKKQYYKSGPKQGEVKMRIKAGAKFKKYLDISYIYKSFLNATVVVLEDMGTSVGNTAQATRTTASNLGKLLAAAELAGCKVHLIAANKWKKDLGLSSDKLESVIMAEELTGRVFRTDKGALLDGEAEAFLIWHWYSLYGEEYFKTKKQGIK